MVSRPSGPTRSRAALSNSCLFILAKVGPPVGGVPRLEHVAESKDPGDEVRIAFDGDAVVFSAESDEVFKNHGLQAFLQHERENAKTPMSGGPFGNFLRKLSMLRQIFMNDQGVSRVRIAIVTARNAPAHARVVHTLRD
jgi:5'-nucleotidase